MEETDGPLISGRGAARRSGGLDAVRASATLPDRQRRAGVPAGCATSPHAQEMQVPRSGDDERAAPATGARSMRYRRR